MSGLFGQGASNSGGGGLFSAKATASTGTGLFGLGSTSGATPQPAGTGGLFGSGGLGGGAQQQQQPAASLFGNTAQQQPAAAGGLFGNTTQQKTGGSSLFGASGLGASQPQQAGGILGGLGGQASQPQQQTPLAASTGPIQQSQNGQNHAYFDSILEKSRKRAYVEPVGEDLPQLQLGLGDLRQRIKRLAPSAPDRTVDGKAHYLLAASGVDPGAAVRDLNLFKSVAAKNDRVAIEQPIDTDVEGYLANLQTQTTLSMISDGLARSVRDFDAFLEDNVTMEWDAQRKRIYQHFGIKPREEVAATGRASIGPPAADGSAGFGRSRRTKASAIAGSRGAGPAGMSSFGRSSLQRSAIGAATSAGKPRQPVFTDMEKQMEGNGTSGPSDRFQRDKQQKYAEKVQSLNAARLQKRPYPVCQQFGEVVAKLGEQHGPEILKAYKALKEIVSEDPEVESLSDPLAAKERQFAAGYLELSQKSSGVSEVRKKILRGGTRCFEKLAFAEVESVINKNPREANLGGIPNVISKVKAYVRLLAFKKNLCGDNVDLQMLGDDYVWALIYYLLRTGHIQEIVDYVAANSVAFRAIDRNFGSYINDYCGSPDRRLRRDLQDRIVNEYNQRLRIAPENSIDPYRMACYKIIGRCDLRSRQLEGLNHNVEDFVWLQLVLARESNRVEENASEAFGLAEVQTTLKDIGDRFFGKGNPDAAFSFGAYVFFQIACGMFEQAVAYIYPFSYSDGVHLAIALDFYGLLRVSNPQTGGEDLLSWTTTENPQINFGRMLGYYTRDFRAANVAAAVDYLVLICLNQDLPSNEGISQVTLCHDALRELVLESREFALLLGDVTSDGQRAKGLVQERMKLIGLSEKDEFMRLITIQAASAADDNGRMSDAAFLYHLAGEYNTVLIILNRALGEALAVPFGQEPLRLKPTKSHPNPTAQQLQGGSLSLSSIDSPQELAKYYLEIYQKSLREAQRKMKAIDRDTLVMLLRISELQLWVEQRRYTDALDGIADLQILPIGVRGNASAIRQFASKFSSIPSTLAPVVPNILMWAITCANGIRREHQASAFSGNDGDRQRIIEDMKQTNMDLTTYTSQLRYRLPAHIHEALARAQSE